MVISLSIIMSKIFSANDLSITVMVEGISGKYLLTFLVIFTNYFIRNGNVVVAKKKLWTEEDEARRIQQVF